MKGCRGLLALQSCHFFAIAMAMSDTQNTSISDLPAPVADPTGVDLPTTPARLLEHLAALGIRPDVHHHPAVFTVAEAEAVDRAIEGAHCRNLFLRDKKKNNFLVVLRNDTPVDIKKLQSLLGSDRLSFGSADRLWDYLGVRPGSVCPYSIINDTQHQVQIYLEKGMMEESCVNYHPLINTMTIGVAPSDLLRFIESTGHTPHIIDLTLAAPDDGAV